PRPGHRTSAGGGPVTRVIRVRVNDQEHERPVEVRRTLADFLREDLDLTGTHLGCEHGVCGACTVLLEGEPVRACLLLAVQADGAVTSAVPDPCDLTGGLPRSRAVTRACPARKQGDGPGVGVAYSSGLVRLLVRS